MHWRLTSILVLGMSVIGAGCAHGGHPEAAEDSQPRYEHVFQKPLPEALLETRKLLEEHGFIFENTQDDTQLLTTWKPPDRRGSGNVQFSRYLVTGLRVAPRQSVVRIFRMSTRQMGNDVEHQEQWWKVLRERGEQNAVLRSRGPTQLSAGAASPEGEQRGVQVGQRDLELEKALTLRLESAPSLELVGGNIADEPRATPVRDADFYVARWKDDEAVQGTCGEQVRGLEPLISPSLTLLIGEQLGSNEMPHAVGDILCQLAETGLPVVLGLSIPAAEQARLDAYLASPGAPANQDSLLAGRFWQRPYQDGRSSCAILDLIDRVRGLRLAGLRVSLVAYDTDEARGSERDAVLAEVWRRRRASQPQEIQLVLAGNIHTRTEQGAPWDSDFTPMAHLLAKSTAPTILEVGFAQGTRWGCDLNPEGRLVCGVVGATPMDRLRAVPGQSSYIQLEEKPSSDGVRGILFVGTLTPSLPAILGPQVQSAPSISLPGSTKASDTWKPGMW
ncbi:hypothetical protein KRR26_17925 [Corallococcus sp. M34]|uniref:hypothetical protein n=1 Tax=Citreicoccus inhibens TaxID=2849499 RepID=UPI001C21F06E|nr:hypothetical protein [Citreicoccus inhibens]MBU8897499.1 hypothetical protein [Citreicoccus inhibens]